MKIIVAADTDIGTRKGINQDSFSVKVFRTGVGRLALVVLCDGMGGLQCGELASAEVIRCFDEWSGTQLPRLCRRGLQEDALHQQWSELLSTVSGRLCSYGERNGIRIGTTVVVGLFTESNIYVANVGDSRMYEVGDQTNLLTRDHSLVWREVEAGRLTPEQAKHHPRRNILTQCIGGRREPVPDFYKLLPRPGVCYMFCSDGFCHELTDEELQRALRPENTGDEIRMRRKARDLINLVKDRGETDNITVILLRCVNDGDDRTRDLTLSAGESLRHRIALGMSRCTLEQEIRYLQLEDNAP